MTIPFYQELAIKNVYPKLKDKDYLKLYLPDYPESVMPERSFSIQCYPLYFQGRP